MDMGSYRELLDRVFNDRGRTASILAEMDGPIVAQSALLRIMRQKICWLALAGASMSSCTTATGC